MRDFSDAERRELVQLVGSDTFLPAAKRIRALEAWCSFSEYMLKGHAPSAGHVAGDRRKLRRGLVRIAAASRALHAALSDWNARLLFDSAEAREIRAKFPRLADDELNKEADERQSAMIQNLAALCESAEHAAEVLRPQRGRPLDPGRTLFTWQLCRQLMLLGVPFQTGVETPMVKACSIVWAALGLSGDPRDSLRTLDDRFGMGSYLRTQLIEPPSPTKRRRNRGANSKP